MIILLVIVILVSLLILYFLACRKDSYRIIKRTSMYTDGKFKTEFTVEQKNSIFGLTWWIKKSQGGEWDNGSVFDNIKAAHTYINSIYYNKQKKSQVVYIYEELKK